METVTFSREKLVRFKWAYDHCTGESFWFEDNQYLKAYAKYLIDFLDSKLKKGDK